MWLFTYIDEYIEVFWIHWTLSTTKEVMSGPLARVNGIDALPESVFNERSKLIAIQYAVLLPLESLTLSQKFL